MIINLYIPGNPVAKARPRFARRGKFVTTYNPQETEEGLWAIHAIEQIKKYKLDAPISGSISVDCSFAFPRPKNHYGKNGLKKSASRHHVGRPDVDNCLKYILDVLNHCGIWYDDSQVTKIKAEKFWATDNISGTSIVISVDGDENE